MACAGGSAPAAARPERSAAWLPATARACPTLTRAAARAGLQAQTAECLVVGEMAAQHLVVALNKTDLLPEADRPKAIKKAQKRLAAAFASTRFAGAPMVPVCARPGGGGEVGGSGGGAAEGVEELKQVLLGMAAPRALAGGGAAPLLFVVDHCFAIKGQGTVLTGTVLQVRAQTR